MAYAFSKTQEMVGDDPQKQDIFGGGGSQPLAPDQQQQQQVSQFQQPAMQKTSTEGDLGAVKDSGSQQSASDPTPADQSRIFSANQGKTSTPGGVYGIRDQIAKNEQALQDKANQYTQDYKTQYDFYQTPQTIEKAIGGDKDAYTQTSQLLNRQMVDPVENRLEGIQDLYVQDMDLLENRAGLQQLASKGKDPRYSQGMSAFDVMLMQRDPAFTGLINEIQAENKALESQLETRPDELRQQAADYGAEALERAQTGTESYLSAAQRNLEAQNQAEADAYNEMLKRIDRDKITYDAGQEAYDQVYKDIMQTYGDRGERFITRERGNFDPMDFATFDEGGYGHRDFVDADEAARFNSIMGLLGSGGEAYTEAAGPGERYSFDTTGLQNTLFDRARAGREEADRLALEEADRIYNEAQIRADEDDARRLGLRGSFDAERQAATDELLGGTDYIDYFKNSKAEIPALPANIRDWYTDEMRDAYRGGLDNPVLDLNAADVYTEEEAKRLNELTQDLTNVGGITQAGEYQDTGEFFDPEDYKKYLIQKMTEHAQTYRGYDPETGEVNPMEAMVWDEDAGELVRRGDIAGDPNAPVLAGQTTLGEMPSDVIPVNPVSSPKRSGEFVTEQQHESLDGGAPRGGPGGAYSISRYIPKYNPFASFGNKSRKKKQLGWL